MKKTFFLILFSIFIYTATLAQSTRKFQLWTDFDPTYKIGQMWRVGGDLGYRAEPSLGSQTVYIRPGVSFSLAKIIKFTVGIASFNSWHPGLFSTSEFRLFQFVQVAWPRIGNFQFTHRVGLEQRWFYIPELGLDKFVNRARYYLELVSPEFKLFGIDAPFFITTNIEILGDVNNNEFGRLLDHNRFTIGVGNQISDRFRADIRYKIISLSDKSIINSVRELEVIRIRLYYQFASS